MRVQFTATFDRNLAKLRPEVKTLAQERIEDFLESYTRKVFPKSLRVHKCGPFISVSVTMNYRIYILPISDGIRFCFIGDHKDADNYLKR